MQIYDIGMLVILLGATLFGAWKGMAWQIASLASFVVSYFASLRFSESLAPYFGQQAPWNRFLAMLCIYVGTSMVIWFLFRFVADMIDRVKLREFDRQIGALFGAAKGAGLCVVVTFFAVTLAPQSRDSILHSRSGYYIAVLIARADAVMPREIHQVLDPYLDKLEQQLDPTKPSPQPAPATMPQKPLGERRSGGI